MANTVTAAQIRNIAGSAARADLVAAIVRGWPVAVEKAGLTTKLRAAHFLAQIMTETGGLRILEESGAYRAKQILKIFGAKQYSRPLGGRGHSAGITPPEAERIAALPVAKRGPVLFNRVYGVGNPSKMREFNNTGPNDGWLYRGGGMMQATGKSNYALMEKKTGLPLVAHPELLHQPDSAFMAAYLEWAQGGRCNAAADRDDVVKVRAIINGGDNGLPECRAYLAKAKKALGNYGSAPVMAAFAEPDDADDDAALLPDDDADDSAADIGTDDDALEAITDPEVVERVQARLKKLGYYDIGKPDGDIAHRTEGAILAFRNENGLPLRPSIDSEFLAALAQAQPRPISDTRASATTDDLRAEGVETISLTDRFKKWAGRIFGVGVAGSTGTGILATWIGKLSDMTSISGEMIAVIILALLALLGIAGVGLIVWFVADKIERKRVDDYRKAKNT